MLSKAQINHIQSLWRKKNRQSQGLFTAEGHKVVLDILDSNDKVVQIFALSEWIANNRSNIEGHGIQYVEINEKDLKRISSLSTPNQVVAIVEIPSYKNIELGKGLTLVLDGISDPGNMGTIIRTADWFGIDTIVCSPHCVDIYNPKVVQATMGSITRVKVHYLDLLPFLQKHDIPKLATTLGGEDLYKINLPQQAFLIIGSESHGVSQEVLKLTDQQITIPSFGKAESLNAGMATGIILSHYRMQHPA